MKKREKPLTAEEIGKELQLDLTPLANRLVGKKIVEIEHCLIEALGALKEWERRRWEGRRYAFAAMKEAANWREFIEVFKEHQGLRGEMMSRYSIAGPLGRFFWAYKEKLMDFEDKQETAGKESTVAHARILAWLIYNELDQGFGRVSKEPDEVMSMWSKWMNSKEQTS